MVFFGKHSLNTLVDACDIFVSIIITTTTKTTVYTKWVLHCTVKDSLHILGV